MAAGGYVGVCGGSCSLGSHRALRNMLSRSLCAPQCNIVCSVHVAAKGVSALEVGGEGVGWWSGAGRSVGPMCRMGGECLLFCNGTT
jgi:hypothetical protein